VEGRSSKLGLPQNEGVAKPAPTSQPDGSITYIDTTELYFGPLRWEAYQDIARHGRVKKCTNRHGHCVGYLLIVNQPTRAKIRQIDQLWEKYKGTVHRFDVATDRAKIPASRAHIEATAILKWSPKGKLKYDGNTAYWIDWSQHKRSRRQLVLYDDRPSKVTQQPCIHFELRFLRAKVVRRQGVHRPRDLLRLNPQELFDRHVSWSNAADQFVKKLMRKQTQQVRKRNRYGQNTKLNRFIDKYLGSIHKRIAYVLDCSGMNKAQSIASISG
jgi:hypothetical protein